MAPPTGSVRLAETLAIEIPGPSDVPRCPTVSNGHATRGMCGPRDQAAMLLTTCIDGSKLLNQQTKKCVLAPFR